VAVSAAAVTVAVPRSAAILALRVLLRALTRLALRLRGSDAGESLDDGDLRSRLTAAPSLIAWAPLRAAGPLRLLSAALLVGTGPLRLLAAAVLRGTGPLRLLPVALRL
jgi:hypothetical protein